MAWARIDDAFTDHEKVLTLLDHEDGAAAIGLWTLCLAWAHRNTRRKGKTPGLLPSTLPRRLLGARGRELAELLVKVRLWDEVDDGWMIHAFADYLPGKEVSEARAAAGRLGAAARWGKRQPDSNLPSGCHESDGKPDGESMASDGNASPSSGPAQPDELQSDQADPPDGTEPSGDSNLPSVSHSSDGKSIASDGSRTRSRREWEWVGNKAKDRTSVTLPHESASRQAAAPTLIALPSPSSSPKPPEPGSDADPQFVAFWAAYPRKVGKPSARNAWRKALKNGADPQAIIAAAARFRDDPARRRSDIKFTPHPATWLNDERWADPPPEPDENVWRWDDVQEYTPREFNDGW